MTSFSLNLKPTLCLVVILLVISLSQGQSKPTTEADYNGTFSYAVSETNSAYPVIFKVEVENFSQGKVIRKSTETVENQAELHSRSTTTIVDGGKTRTVYEILIGEQNGFCKEGDGPWRKSQYVCFGSNTIFGPRTPESVEYSVEEKVLNGKSVKIYRKYSIFPGKSGKQFEEEVATIDADGYFINVVDTSGTLNPKVVSRIQKQTWTIKAKIKPIEAPIK
ncbi:MAG: hypothetical protein KA746_06195 [Pyrinomonadaceae bacterium]|nr:hypothetical protein [Pyrinomonadaceae bacterium]